LTIPLLVLYAAWAVTLFDLHYFLVAFVSPAFGRLGTALYLPLLLMTVVQGPMLITSARNRQWYPPFLLLLLAAFCSLPAAVNLLIAKDRIQILLVYYALAVATLVYVRTARQAVPILAMLAGQFLWWAIWARTSGAVPWNPTLSNFDGFGGLMVQGAGICFWFGLATRSPQLRLALFALAAYCVVGVVASFARGAFLSLVALAGIVWLRSPRKLLTGGVMVAGAIVVVFAAAFLFGRDVFVAEMMSSFSEGTTQGTGALRWGLWEAAIKSFVHHPVFGVGPGNFGAYASTIIRPGEIPAWPEPNMFYGQNLHNSYLQVLSEFGIVGMTAFVLLIVDFFKRNRALWRPDAAARWAQLSGGRFELRQLALALEAANAANLLGGIFYASLLMPWFWMIWTANRMLWQVTRPEASPAPIPAGPPTRTLVRHSRRG